tara:strand:+ start:621 stop:932 length:312 start_codon:yes stop_codon:yes gene_type:complete
MVKTLLLAAVVSFQPDLEIKINGLVCSSCAIGVKRGFKKEINVSDVKFDTRRQVTLIDLKESEAGRVYWIKNEKIVKIVKDAGYEVTSIKRLWNKKPNRYNKP